MSAPRFNMDPLKELITGLETAEGRHRKRYGDEIIRLTAVVEKEYGCQVRSVLAFLRNDRMLCPILDSSYLILEHYLNAMRWVGWGDCEFGPPLHIESVEVYALGMLLYLSARLIDDGIDGHEKYKSRVQSYYGFLIKERIHQRAAAGLSCMMGNGIFASTMDRLIKKKRMHDMHVLTRMYSSVLSGAFAEATIKERSMEIYRSIINKKSVSYDMMLHYAFFVDADPDIRAMVLGMLAGMSEAAQWLNDLCDAEDDAGRNQLNMVALPGMNRYKVFSAIARALNELWEKSHGLPGSLKDAMAARLIIPARSLLEKALSL